MAAQSEIGTWQQVAAWEKSVGPTEGRSIAPSAPRLKSVKQAAKPDQATADLGSRHFLANHRKLDEI
jgi:hypothetical protein